jgi:BirA family biotin operon repressor/biotin-[acetyl-CoA-carboxylase] ligase
MPLGPPPRLGGDITGRRNPFYAGSSGGVTQTAMIELSADTIRQGLPTRVFGQTVYYYPQIGSTNTALKQLADAGAPEGTLLLADEQLAGRGRFERRWHAPAGSSLLTSLLFRPTFLAPDQAQHLTMLCALGAVEAIAAQTGLQIGLKWPNDLVYGGRKLAGILTELSFAGDQLAWGVVGLGLNVNLDFEAIAGLATPGNPPLSATATSLQTVLGQPVSRLALLCAYLVQVEERYDALRAGESPRAAWAERLITLGREVTVSGSGVAFHGLAEAVDDVGALLVRRPDGRLERVLAGEVTLTTMK